MELFGVARFERFFRAAAGLDVDKDDLRRFDDFLNDKIYDLLLRGQANAKANGRDVIEPQDLPITKGLQESIYAFKRSIRRCRWTRSSSSSPGGHRSM